MITAMMVLPLDAAVQRRAEVIQADVIEVDRKEGAPNDMRTVLILELHSLAEIARIHEWLDARLPWPAAGAPT